MSKKLIAIGIVVAILFTTIGAGAAITLAGGAGSQDVSEPTDTPTATPTPQPEPVNQSEIPQAAQDSAEGAKLLQEKLQDTEKFSDARVFVTKQGEVVVVYTSEVQHGAELKPEMTEVAVMYAGVVGEEPKTGGLTVAANGVEMLVSSDAALAYDEDRLKKSAYKETFVFKSSESGE